jgi:hypothetical protein
LKTKPLEDQKCETVVLLELTILVYATISVYFEKSSYSTGFGLKAKGIVKEVFETFDLRKI